MADTVQQIKDRLSIVDVVSGYAKLVRSGASLKARCPFHAEKTPSFHVSPERGSYHCFGCGVGGDVFSFVQAIEGVDFKGALKILADRAGVKIENTKGDKKEDDAKDQLFAVIEAATLFFQSKLTKEAKKYLHERGLTEETITTFRIGYAGNGWTDCIDHLKQKKYSEKEMQTAGIAAPGEKGLRDKFRNRIMFPISDTAGRVVAFSGRTFGPGAHPDAPKYLNSPETPLYHKSRILYGFDKAKQPMRQLQCAVLVEGQMDLVLSHQAGWANTVAVSGTAFTEEHARLIKRMTDNVVLALDSDEAGIKAASKAARIALASGIRVKVARILSGKDPADLIAQEGAEAWKEAIKKAKDIITFLLDVLEEHTGGGDKFRRTVEVAVVPFLADVQSPIDRDAYAREIGKRIGVSESAVMQALDKTPRPLARREAAVAQHAPVLARKLPERARLAYGILLWQQVVPKPSIDIVLFEKNLRDAMGEALFAVLSEMTEGEKEQLRFRAEQLYGSTKLSKEEARILLHVEHDRSELELKNLTELMRKAEERGDEASENEIQGKIGLLTSRIAQIKTKV